jgi:universal stress protein A
MKIRRILVPVDFSATSLQALDRAIDLGKQFKAELLILFVVEPVIYAGLADLDGTSANLQALLRSQQSAGREELARLAAQLEKRHGRLLTRIQIGQPWAVIVNEAKKSRADLIIMATHGRTGLSHLFMGSVAEKVVRSATCPVLTLRPPARAPRPRRRGGAAARAAEHR